VADRRDHLGALGTNGLTAYFGLLEVGQPKPGDTVVVSAAAGSVGHIVGQLANLRECRVVGIAGSDEKCRLLVDELGFDAAVNYKDANFRAAFKDATPDRIDVYFDNTGGPVTAAAYALLRQDARIALCGLVAEYALPDAPGPNMKHVLARQATVTGFSVRRNLHRMDDYRRNAAALIREGRLRFAEDVTQGLENAPAAFDGLLAGRTFGKCLVKVS
jgi:NADPH-dependent curcumin reductase CurA